MAKNMYIGVGNVARKVKQPNVGVGNVARKVKSGFIGVDNVARQFFSGGTPLSALAIGTVVKLNESGVAQEYIVVNQGIPGNSSHYDSSCNGTWLLRKDVVSQSVYWEEDDSLAYGSSDINAFLQGTMLSKYDANIQNIIKQVKIPYMYGVSTLKTGSEGLSCKLFALSGYEVGITNTIYISDISTEGSKLDYFETDVDGTSTSSPPKKRVAYFNGKASDWWLRSVRTSGGYAYKISSVGMASRARVSKPGGVRPALIMPFETLVNADMNIIAA